VQQNQDAPSSGWLMRSAEFIGDFANPFYREERQRDVWNEASAVGLQLMIWLNLVAATVTIWVGGRAALPYTLTLVALLGVASWVTVLYAARLGVRADQPQRLKRGRMVPYVLLAVVLVAGILRATEDGSSPSTVLGALVGAGLVGLAVVLAKRRGRSRGDQGED